MKPPKYDIKPLANLHGANLRGANLYGANLRGANLHDANLHGADLHGANLRGADLYDANLDGVNLRGADLRGASLYGADLDGANLRSANLDGANLDGVNLRGADLRGASLYGADLRGASLYGADLDGANLHDADLYNVNLHGVKNIPSFTAATLSILPAEGEIIGWKKCNERVLVKLRVPAKARRSNATGRKCRAEYVRVLEVIGAKYGRTSSHSPTTEYHAGKMVRCHQWDADRWNECSGGIHFFLTKEEAEAW